MFLKILYFLAAFDLQNLHFPIDSTPNCVIIDK